MTLVTSLDHFVEEAKKRAPGQAVYIALVDGRVRATCASEDGSLVLCTMSIKSLAEIESQLTKSGCEVRQGEWQSGELAARTEPFWIGAVAYRSKEIRPGLWVEAFSYEPSEAEVTQSFLTELVDQGVVSDLPLEKFIELTSPNVLILSPQEMAGFMESRSSKNCD